MPNVANEQLFAAVIAGDLSVLKEWKTQSEGVDVDCKDNNGPTLLHVACVTGQLECVKYLIESCRVDTNCKDNDGWTPLHAACGTGHLECVKYLIESRGADINCKNNDGDTPLHAACQNGQLECVKYLIESCRANTNCKDNNGLTPLHRACGTGQLECVKYLIESRRADINCKDNKGLTPLHLACGTGQLECVKYLIESRGADINCKDNDGDTPLHVACIPGHPECVAYLVASANADIDIQNNNNKTPLDMIDAKLQIKMINSLDHLSHCNSQLQEQLKENEQETKQLKRQLERKEEEKKQKEEENEQLKQQFERNEQEKKQKEQENEQLKRQLKQHLKISIDQDRRAAVRAEAIADTSFLCGQGDEQQSIKANSGVLIVTVPSIQTLINSGIQHQCAHDGAQDGTEPIQTTIPLPNLQPKHVRHVLQCIYTGEMSFDNSAHEDNANTGDANQPTPTLNGQDDLQQLILVANEFGFWRLKLVLEAELACKHLTQTTMMDVLIFADQHNSVVLKDAAMRLAVGYEQNLFTHPDFKKLFPHIQLMTETQAFCSGEAESDDIGDEYSRMSMMELYKVIDEDEGTAQVDSYMDRATLVDLVRSMRTN